MIVHGSPVEARFCAWWSWCAIALDADSREACGPALPGGVNEVTENRQPGDVNSLSEKRLTVYTGWEGDRARALHRQSGAAVKQR
jgi:hypothetical protein